MRRALGSALVGAALFLPGGQAHAAALCNGWQLPSPPIVQPDCTYCADSIGNPAPPQFCQNGTPGYTWLNCTLWVNGICVVG
jgi:hypothetical protein